MYCPRCRDIYHMKNHVELDGAYFGPYFATAFLMQYPSLVPKEGKNKPLPKLFGFKVHNTSAGRRDDNYNDVVMGN